MAKMIERVEHKNFPNHKILEFDIHYFFCPRCDEEIGKVLIALKDDRIFTEWTILKDNIFPNFCPICGTKLEVE